MNRIDGRKLDQLRPVKITTGFVDYAEGSVLIECGHTKVLCCASVEQGAPRHVPEGTGWVTAEYSMLPRANRERSRRDISKLKLSLRSAEIQDYTITIDCDVLQGDGGTRTASVTGGFIALALACRKMVAEGWITENPIRRCVAAVSAGIVGDAPMLDLCYEEDSHAMVDLNCIMDEEGRLIEIQGTGEGRSFTIEEQQELVSLCAGGIRQLIAKQKEILGGCL